MVKQKTLISLVGPTAIGKTAMSIGLANAFETEIISCDSRQFYREMAIGTAKPSLEELQAAPHHFINSHSIHDTYTAGDYEKEALNKIESLFKKHETLILTGGSGLFEKAVIDGFDPMPKGTKELREELNSLYQKEGLEPILIQLEKLDPEAYDAVEKSNPRRVIRTLEINLAGGKPLSHWKAQKTVRPFQTIRIGLNMDREELYNRINTRVDTMMDEGLLEEVQSLHDFQHLNTLQTVGYSELFAYLNGLTSLDEAIENIKQNTRRYAKRQLTWFRKYPDLTWFEPNQIKDVLEHIMNTINKQSCN